MDRNLWGECWQRAHVPKLPCATCQTGRLHGLDDGLRIVEPQYSKELMKADYWEPSMDVERFVLILQCDNAVCGEFVACTGDTEVLELYDDEYGPSTEVLLRPRTMFPAPRMLPVASLPAAVERELTAAFGLFWADLDSAANRLRVSVERLLDHLQVPTTRLTGKGTPGRLDLNARIDMFGGTHPDHKDSLTAMRMIGNLGSHGSGVVREAFLDALEVYEECLESLLGDRKQRIDAIRKKLIATKGKY